MCTGQADKTRNRPGGLQVGPRVSWASCPFLLCLHLMWKETVSPPKPGGAGQRGRHQAISGGPAAVRPRTPLAFKRRDQPALFRTPPSAATPRNHRQWARPAQGTGAGALAGRRAPSLPLSPASPAPVGTSRPEQRAQRRTCEDRFTFPAFGKHAFEKGLLRWLLVLAEPLLGY